MCVCSCVEVRGQLRCGFLSAPYLGHAFCCLLSHIRLADSPAPRNSVPASHLVIRTVELQVRLMHPPLKWCSHFTESFLAPWLILHRKVVVLYLYLCVFLKNI